MTLACWRSATALAALLLASAASAVAPAPADSALHGYVLGRYAFADDQLGAAARYFDMALDRDPGDVALLRRTFDLAVAAGDARLALSLANRLSGSDRNDSTVALVRLSDAVRRKDWAAADSLRTGITGAGYAQVVGPIVEAWVRFGRGDADGALALLDPDKQAGIAKSYIAEQRAHMLAAAGRYAEAAEAYRALMSATDTGINWLRVGLADALQAQGKTADLEALFASAPGDLPLAGARQRAAAGRRIGPLAPDPKAGLAWMSVRLAADLSRERPVPLALVFARISTFLDPGMAVTWIMTGDVLARGGQEGAALTAYAKVPAGDPMAAVARTRTAGVLADTGRKAEALTLLEAAVAAPGAGVDDWVRLGDWYRAALRPGDAAAAYTKAIAVAGTPTPWTLLFLRGSAYEQAGDWPRAEADLRAALAASPQEPVVLNYLGYSLLDRGLKLPEAQTLIEQAAKLRPDDGAIADSLGWAYYRTGQYARAVDALEAAAAAEPGDPTINDHLGDAYWRVGRKLEARFRWRAALDLEPTPQLKTALKTKLDYGLDYALAQARK